MVLCALAVGLIAGFGAVAFRAMIGGFHNLLFLGRWSFDYDANVHTPASPWDAGVILVPVLGAIGVAFLVMTFAPEAKGHGVPEVMEAIYHKDGRIRPVVALIKSLASALSIGSGGSVGREGPIIQVGAAFGSTLGQLIALPVRHNSIAARCACPRVIAARTTRLSARSTRGGRGLRRLVHEALGAVRANCPSVSALRTPPPSYMPRGVRVVYWRHRRTTSAAWRISELA